MVAIKDKIACCGCSACASVCPQKCIKMTEDEEGFRYPTVNLNNCIKCGLCEKICPVKNQTGNQEPNKNSFIKAYAAYIKEENIRNSSSSGGIFSALAEWILKNNGVVFGASFDENMFVHHIAITENAELSKIRGSKYVQSDLESTFLEEKQCINGGYKVLFTGTECQVEGLKSYLGKQGNDDNLITVDILCHGVPSIKLWSIYLKWQESEHNATVTKISFRDKKYGWKKFATRIEFSDGSVYEQVNSEDPFMRMFLANICLRPSCHKCKFKGINRCSDITLGDCWQVERHSPEMDDDGGTSVVLIHSSKGEKIYRNVRKKIIDKEIEIKDAIPKDAESLNSATSHMNRSKFFRELQRGATIPELLNLLDLSFWQKAQRKIKRIIQK